jgi:hypothetical protein
MNTEQIQQLKNEIKLCLVAAAEEAGKEDTDGKQTFHIGLSLFWDHENVCTPIMGIISGWILCKGMGRVNLGLITEAKNEYLQELNK